MNARNPIETLSAAIYAACLRDLPEIKYQDRDWKAHREFMDSLTRDQKAEHYAKEKNAGSALGPTIEKSRRPEPTDVHVTMFAQTWGSTALGYGGMGGQAITEAYTVTVYDRHSDSAAVYFGETGRLAYVVSSARSNQPFIEDTAKHSMASVSKAYERYSLPEQLLV